MRAKILTPLQPWWICLNEGFCYILSVKPKFFKNLGWGCVPEANVGPRLPRPPRPNGLPPRECPMPLSEPKGFSFSSRPDGALGPPPICRSCSSICSLSIRNWSTSWMQNKQANKWCLHNYSKKKTYTFCFLGVASTQDHLTLGLTQTSWRTHSLASGLKSCTDVRLDWKQVRV